MQRIIAHKSAHVLRFPDQEKQEGATITYIPQTATPTLRG